MKRILLIGNGAREHVLAETIVRSPQRPELYVYGKAKNPGIFHLAQGYEIGDLTDLKAICAYGKKIHADVCIIGPEDPIALGLRDALMTVGIETIAPVKRLALLEASKSFTRDLLAKYGIPGNPLFRVCRSVSEARMFAEELAAKKYAFVIKADGLMAGKGVRVQGDHFRTIDEGMTFVEECLATFGKVVLEEKLVGQEFSLMSFADGLHTADMPVVQDHKRAFEGDKGPNTGGMGTYSDHDHLLPFLRTEDIDQARMITKMVQEALWKETGEFYRGIMYGGFMAVRDGVRLIEYNMRFGDPEAMNVLPLLQTDFLDICQAMIDRSLDQVPVMFGAQATVCKYVVPNGYPDAPVKSAHIEVPHVSDNIRMYFGSVDQREDGLVLCGSRAVAMVGIADTLEQAESFAEAAARSVSGPVFHRKDIGTAALIKKRVSMMKKLRK